MLRSFSFWLLALFIFVSCDKDADDGLPVDGEYITWNLSGAKDTLALPADTVAAMRVGSNTELGGFNNRGSYLYFIFSGNASTGTYSTFQHDMVINYHTYFPSSGSIKITINNYGNVGDYIMGSYSGSVRDSVMQQYSLSGRFKIRRR